MFWLWIGRCSSATRPESSEAGLFFDVSLRTMGSSFALKIESSISSLRHYVSSRTAIILLLSLLLLSIHCLQLGRHTVTAVVTCYISTDYEDFTLKFKYGGLHEKHLVATWNCREPSQHLLKDPGKPRKT